MSDALFIEKYGPSYLAVMGILTDINRLDKDKVRTLVHLDSPNIEDAAMVALDAATRWDIESEVVRASEDCRREVWNVMWGGSTQAEAWNVSWVASRAGLGAAVEHLVDRGEYQTEHHLTLLGSWRAIFPQGASDE